MDTEKLDPGCENPVMIIYRCTCTNASFQVCVRSRRQNRLKAEAGADKQDRRDRAEKQGAGGGSAGLPLP